MHNKWDIISYSNPIHNNKLQWTLLYLHILKHSIPGLFLKSSVSSSWSYYIKYYLNLKPTKNTQQNVNPVYNNFLQTNFKLTYKNQQLFNTTADSYSTKPVTPLTNASNTKLFNSFKSYLRVNVSSHSSINKPHFTFKHFYLGYSRGGLSILNVSKFYTRWKDTYNFLFNLYYYEVEILTFGTSFFKNEILSLNWQIMSKFKFMWRYTTPFLIYKPNKITTYGDFVFYRLNLLGLNIAMVFDILYHSKTIYYLHRSHFYTIGLVPINYNINTLQFAIPTSADNLFSQIFFLRFVTLVQQNTFNYKYTNMKKLWQF